MANRSITSMACTVSLNKGEDHLLEHTFIHIPGIGPKTERHLWGHGILTWGHFLNSTDTPLPPARDALIRANLDASLANRDNIRFFAERLAGADLWRVYEAFKDGAVYLDIETTGFYQGVDEITLIGLYDGHTVKTFIKGINLTEFELEITSYQLVITFNGSQFDLPFIRRQFPYISLPPAHIDLRFFLRRLGYRGGLKSIEKSCGLSRAREINGMDGYDAVLLWRDYQWGDEAALDRLILYNTADIVHLKPLMERGYQEMKTQLLPLKQPTL
jgi:uncharacterized protein YprB with RNaseH-like and TPR domain